MNATSGCRCGPCPRGCWPARSTLGTGGALGFEGPAIYLGTAIGTATQRISKRLQLEGSMKVLMVAGAAAGVSAVFKTPVTGALFALEVPYEQDVAARAVLPAIVASAASYLTFVAFQGVAPLFSVSGNPGFTIGDLAGAAGVGLACGIGARVFVKVMWLAKEMRTWLPRRWAWLVGGAGLAVITASSFSIFGQSLVLGPGYRTLTWVSTPDRATGLIALLMGMRLLASALTVSGGGAGGLFIPLVIEGALLGRLLSGFAHASSTLFPLVGAAAFLGAGYQTPIAAVVFVAEATGRPGFVVPGLIATVVAQLVMGGNSVTGAKEPSRRGHVEERLRLRVSAAMVRDGVVVDPATTIDRLLHDDFLRARARSLPVVEADGAYLGMVRLSDVADVPIEERDDRTVSEMLRREVPAAETGWTLREAVVAMQASGVDRLAVTDGERYIGAVSMSDILRLDEIIEATEGAAEPD